MIFLNIDKDEVDRDTDENLKNEEIQPISDSEKIELLARVTLDKRLNARDLKLYSYAMNFGYKSNTQENIADMLEMTRSNVNVSLAKLTAFNYIKKIKEERSWGRMKYELKNLNEAGICKLETQAFMRLMNVGKTAKKDKFNCFENEESAREAKLYRKYIIRDIENIDNFISKGTTTFELFKHFISRLGAVELEYKIQLEESARLYHMKDKDKDKVSLKDGIFNGVLHNLKNILNGLNRDLEDTKKIEKDFIEFRENFYKETNVLDKDEMTEFLKDDTLFLLLFVDRSKDDRIIKFKEQYYDAYIKFLVKFTNLGENKTFFKILYENDMVEEFAYEDILKIFGFTHRDAPTTKASGRNFIANCTDSFREKIDYIHKVNSSSLSIGELRELNKLLSNVEYVIGDGTSISSFYTAIILVLTGKINDFKDCYNISFDDYFSKLDNWDSIERIYELQSIYKDLERKKKI